jgi:RNA polymerase sigma-B factor
MATAQVPTGMDSPTTPIGVMTTIAIRAPVVAPPAGAGTAQRSTVPHDGQWRPGLRRAAVAARLAGHAPQPDCDLADGLLAEMAGLVDSDPRRARLRARVIEWYLPMAAFLARRFAGRSALLDDLTQVAAVGLIKAVDRFDPARGVDFGSFAVPTIVGEIKRHFRDTTWAVRVPRRLQELKMKMPAATADLFQTLQRVPTNAELADRLGISPLEIVSAQLSANAYRPCSIDRSPSFSPGLRPEDWLGGPDPDLEAVDNRTTLRVLLGRLPVREQRILAMRFEADMTQAQIAVAVGVSQMHVSRLLLKSLARLREDLISDAPHPGGQTARVPRRRPPSPPAPVAVAGSAPTLAA